MTEPIGFYFDFVSPYGYLGSVGIEQVAERTGREVDWRPMLLGITVFKVMKLPSVPDTPLKGPYAAHDWPRFARRLGLPHDPDAAVQFASLHAMRAFAWIKGRDPELAREFGRVIYSAHWGEGRDMSAPLAVAQEASRLGVDVDACLAAMADDTVKQTLRDAVDAAVDKGVFGCPTYLVDGEMFWGADRLEQVEDWITTGGW